MFEHEISFISASNYHIQEEVKYFSVGYKNRVNMRQKSSCI